MLKDSPHPHCSAKSASVPSALLGCGLGHTDIGIPEYESLVQLVFYPIHLTANDAEKCLAIDQNFDAVLLHCLVKCASLIDVF